MLCAPEIARAANAYAVSMRHQGTEKVRQHVAQRGRTSQTSWTATLSVSCLPSPIDAHGSERCGRLTPNWGTGCASNWRRPVSGRDQIIPDASVLLCANYYSTTVWQAPIGSTVFRPPWKCASYRIAVFRRPGRSLGGEGFARFLLPLGLCELAGNPHKSERARCRHTSLSAEDLRSVTRPAYMNQTSKRD